MLIKHKIGNLASFDTEGRVVDLVAIEWHEARKRILHKKTFSGKEVVMKFLNESSTLSDGDILWSDEITVIAVAILSCEVIIIHPKTMLEIASVCYEIGNKHLPLFYENDELLIPFDAPAFRLLTAAGHNLSTESRKLINQLKTTVSPHGYAENKQTLFSKILQLTSP